MKTAAWTTLVLATVLLAGCEAGADSREATASAGFINPYPPGTPAPFFFRSASDWQPYAPQKSARAQQRE